MTGRPSAPPGQADLAPAPATASSANQTALPSDHDFASAKVDAGVEAAQSRLDEQSERLLWTAYCRAIALQWAEPGPVTTIIRNATYDVWQRVFLAEEDGGQP